MSTGTISAQDVRILQQAFDRAGRDQEDPNADIASHYKKLRGIDTEGLKEIYSRSHRVTDLKGVPRYALITDILRDRFGENRVEKFFKTAGRDFTPADLASKNPRNPAGEGMKAARRDDAVRQMRKEGKSDEEIMRRLGMEEKEFRRTYGKDADQDPRVAVLKDWPKILHDKLGQLIDNGSISPATNEADLFRYAKQAVPQAPDEDVRDCVRDLLANWQPVFDSAARDASFDRKIWKPVEIYHGWHLLRGQFENRGKYAVMEPSGQMEVYTNKQDAELHFSESKDSLTAKDAEILEEAIRRGGKDVTPPGREKQVRALKKTDVDNPWAVSWASYEKSH